MSAISAQADGKNATNPVDSPIADAPPANWVDRYAPAWLKPWLRLVRADRPIGAWLLMWPCWWSVALAARADYSAALADGANDFVDFRGVMWLLILFAIGAFAMRSAGCIYNDIIDRDIDAKVARTKGRPLASGQISVTSATVFAFALCLVGLTVLLQFNIRAVLLGFGSAGVVLIYPFMKRVTFWAQAVLGLAFSWGALLGWAAYYPDGIDWPPVILYAAAIAWTIGYDTIYAHQDKDDDVLMGLKSTALKFGDQTHLWLSLFFGIAIGGIAFAGWSVGAGLWFYLGLALAAAHAVWQIATLDTENSQNCLDRFRSNHGFGAIVFLALALDTALAVLD
jgi:4-hydroxybenzoate polyprenyltransferase